MISIDKDNRLAKAHVKKENCMNCRWRWGDECEISMVVACNNRKTCDDWEAGGSEYGTR